MAKTRTFIAVEVSPEVRSAAAALAARLQPQTSGYRWVANENLHYTLQFLGDLTDQEIADVCTQVGRAVAGAEPFTLESLGLGAFPSADRPRTLWVGAGRGAEELTGLHAAIDAALEGLGFRGENRRFVPHMTIGKATGRAGGLATLIDGLAEHAAGESPVTEATVFASELSREGPQYHALARCPLGA